MRYAVKGLGLSAALAVVCLAGATGAATAESSRPEGLYAPSALALSIGEGEGPAAATVERAVTLRCSPAPAGDHPDPVRACAELRAVDGEFASLVTDDGDRFCSTAWAPVTVTADGVWDGRRVSFAHTFPNACAASGTTTSVFSF